MRVCKPFINGLKMLDERGGSVVNIQYGKKKDFDWITHTIPCGYEIIGLKVCQENRVNFPKFLKRIGFILWDPKSHQKSVKKG